MFQPQLTPRKIDNERTKRVQQMPLEKFFLTIFIRTYKRI